MSGVKSSRLGYGDFLRCLAALAVVALHCAGATLAGEDPAGTRFFILNLLDGGTRWAVPMFVMLSGAFLLDPKRPMTRRKWLGHLGRVALALLVWGFAYALYDARGAHMGTERFLEALINLVTGQLHYHLWYLPMLLGLYLLLPPLRAMVKGASRQTLWYVLGLWAVVNLGFGTWYAFSSGVVTRPWYNMLGLYSLSGYAGYLLLGYLLRTCRVDKRRAGLCYALGALGLVVTCTGTRLLSQAIGGLDARLYGYLTPNVFFTAAALFLLCRRLDLGKQPLWSKLSACTFGVYLIHPILLHLFQTLGLPRPGWNVAWFVPMEAAALFALSLAVSWVIRKIPKLGTTIC